MAKRQVFYSFHYGNDSWRARQVRNIGVLEENFPVSSNDWEEVKRKRVMVPSKNGLMTICAIVFVLYSIIYSV